MRIKQSHIFLAILVVLSVDVLGNIFTISNNILQNHKKYGIDESTYQAVFLTNSQIYFGHVANVSSEYLKLDNVYYIQISSEGPNKLVKLGNSEPHSPRNELIINKSQVLFIENLSSDSQVIKGIQSFPK